jgi:hypothetical protein
LRLLDSARTRLQKAGITVAKNCPPRGMADQLRQQLDPADPGVLAVHDWLLRLEAQRYAPPAAQRTRLATLKRELKQLVWPP